jgi:hypothetical protein
LLLKVQQQIFHINFHFRTIKTKYKLLFKYDIKIHQDLHILVTCKNKHKKEKKTICNSRNAVI